MSSVLHWSYGGTPCSVLVDEGTTDTLIKSDSGNRNSSRPRPSTSASSATGGGIVLKRNYNRIRRQVSPEHASDSLHESRHDSLLEEVHSISNLTTNSVGNFELNFTKNASIATNLINSSFGHDINQNKPNNSLIKHIHKLDQSRKVYFVDAPLVASDDFWKKLRRDSISSNNLFHSSFNRIPPRSYRRAPEKTQPPLANSYSNVFVDYKKNLPPRTPTLSAIRTPLSPTYFSIQSRLNANHVPNPKKSYTRKVREMSVVDSDYVHFMSRDKNNQNESRYDIKNPVDDIRLLDYDKSNNPLKRKDSSLSDHVKLGQYNFYDTMHSSHSKLFDYTLKQNTIDGDSHKSDSLTVNSAQIIPIDPGKKVMVNVSIGTNDFNSSSKSNPLLVLSFSLASGSDNAVVNHSNSIVTSGFQTSSTVDPATITTDKYYGKLSEGGTCECSCPTLDDIMNEINNTSDGMLNDISDEEIFDVVNASVTSSTGQETEHFSSRNTDIVTESTSYDFISSSTDTYSSTISRERHTSEPSSSSETDFFESDTFTEPFSANEFVSSTENPISDSYLSSSEESSTRSTCTDVSDQLPVVIIMEGKQLT